MADRSNAIPTDRAYVKRVKPGQTNSQFISQLQRFARQHIVAQNRLAAAEAALPTGAQPRVPFAPYPPMYPRVHDDL